MVELVAAMERKDLEEQLKALPARPGVYLFKDAGDNVLYAGKAASLYHRVGSYFGSSQDASPKLRRLVAQVAQFEFFVTDSEQEAILLECNLIKKYRPRFNVRLKDDKTYPYLKVSLGEDWPRVYITRRLENDGARYFGPYASAGSVRTTLALLRKLFPFRSCKKSITDSQSQPCLEYHIGRCLGPCTGAVTQEEYRQVIDQIVLFLEGKQEVIVRELRRNMAAAAKNLEFEKAALLRDQVQSVERVIERQKIASPDEEMDVIAFAQARDQAYVLVYSIRNGKLLGRESFVLTGTQGEGPVKIMTSFVQQFYSSAPFIPKQVLLQHSLEDVPMVQQWLESQKRAKVKVWVPRRGVRKGLVDMVAENARQGLEQMRIKLLTEPEVTAKALAELESELQLPRPPRRVECYDIADIRGTSAVGAMVVFEGGQPKRSHYRRFKIKTVPGANDYAMMQEVLWRRFRKAATEPIGSTWATVPDLVLIDGGKGQLNAALEVLQEYGLDNLAVASLAKQREELFIPAQSEPVILPRDSQALYLVQRVRDEAHRFAVSYHRTVRRKRGLASQLEEVPGIGPKRRQALLQHFGSIEAIRQASVDEMAAVPGMTRRVAEQLKEALG